MENRRKGMTDLPIENNDGDKFNISAYTNGLSSFIETCETPLTIALQGDWGTGKTSFINLVKQNLDSKNEDGKPKIETIIFNTWRYSQFHLKDNLAICFLSYLVDELIDAKDKNFKKTKDVLNKIALISLNMAMGRFGNGVGTPDSRENGVFNDPSKLVEELKGIFEDAIEKKLKCGIKRIVIFIDDLDRLDPKIAVNLLEVIKLFLDVKDCVFVLAIDYSIVTEGIREKFGSNISSEKTQSFFDKIIQVPFKIPTEFYDFENLINDSLKGWIDNKDNLKNIKEVVNRSVGNNPRAVKRLLNSFYLIRSVIAQMEKENNDQQDTNTILLALLCIQLSYEELYKYFCESDKRHIELFENNDTDYLKEELRKYSNYELTDKYIEKTSHFIEILKTTLLDINVKNKDEEKADEIEEADIQSFLDVLVYSNMTNEKNETNNKENNLMTLDEIMDVNEKDKNIKCVKLKLEDEISPNKRFYQSFKWILEEIIKMDQGKVYQQQLEDINHMYDKGVSPRIFLPMIKKAVDNRTDSSENIRDGLVEYYNKSKTKDNLPSNINIEATDIQLVIHYSSIQLCRNLKALLDCTDFDQNKVRVVVTKIK